MNISDFHIIITTKVMNFLSWKRIFIFLLAVMAGCATILGFEFDNFSFHKRIPTAGDKVKLLVVGPNVKARIHSIIIKSDLVIGVRVLTLNFQRNIRIATFSEVEDKNLRDIYQKHLTSRVYDVPIFSDNKVDNNRVLHIVNGEFICIPFKESLSYQIAPEASQYIQSMCTIGIPPYNNDVSGMMSIYFTREPTPEEKDEIFQFMRDLSISIYNESQK